MDDKTLALLEDELRQMSLEQLLQFVNILLRVTRPELIIEMPDMLPDPILITRLEHWRDENIFPMGTIWNGSV